MTKTLLDKVKEAAIDAEQGRKDFNPQTTVRPLQIGQAADGRFVHKALTTVGQVEEEHIYLFYRGAVKGGDGILRQRESIIEADLLGDQATHKSDGKLPPVVHIECPVCTTPEDRRALSITQGNKSLEIEELEQNKWGFVEDPRTGQPLRNNKGELVIIKRRLTVKETIVCDYCHSRFKITDNIMSDA